jgi:hypothetical protein
MTTALIISELLPIHDDALVADIEAAFAEIDREVEETRELARRAALLLDVEWLVDEMLDDTVRASLEGLEISLELRGLELEQDCEEKIAEVA